MTKQPEILYIEDNPDNQHLVKRILTACGYDVLIAEDGLAGLALAREIHPVLILVDINIPGLDGYETTTRLRSIPHLKETPIVALTADVSAGVRERALVAGCDGYLSKPIRPKQFAVQIGEFIGGKRELVAPGIETEMLRAYNHKVVERLEQRVRELVAANAELQEIDQLRSQFLTSLSHELRTPLTSLLGYLDLFARGTLGPINELQQDAVAVMQRNVETLSQQLNNLLYLQEYRSHQLSLTSVHINNMVQHLLRRMQPKVVSGNITLDVTIDEVGTIRADPSALELALSNLLDNAIKFTPAGGRVRMAMVDEQSWVLLRFEDTGSGIPPEALEKIFLPFYRIDTSLTAQPGSGIGLALVRHIVEAHGGQVTVRSVPNQGSIFTITLPKN